MSTCRYMIPATFAKPFNYTTVFESKYADYLMGYVERHSPCCDLTSSRSARNKRWAFTDDGRQVLTSRQNGGRNIEVPMTLK